MLKLENNRGLTDFERFVLGAQAACAEIKSLLFAFNNKRDRLDVGFPTPRGMTFGVTYIIAKTG